MRCCGPICGRWGREEESKKDVLDMFSRTSSTALESQYFLK